MNGEKNNVTVVGAFLQVSKGSLLEPHIVWMGETVDEILTESQILWMDLEKKKDKVNVQTAERRRHGELHEIRKDHLKPKFSSKRFTEMNHHSFWRVKNCCSVEQALNYEKVNWNWNELSHA